MAAVALTVAACNRSGNDSSNSTNSVAGMGPDTNQVVNNVPTAGTNSMMSTNDLTGTNVPPAGQPR
jgi:hypothetical protein